MFKHFFSIYIAFYKKYIFFLCLQAAESYECGNGDKQMTSPAIPWAAFPTGIDLEKQ